MLPDLNRLKVFFHIFNEKSSTGAARVLNITQSGVSQHLKKLEEELQVSLFTRVNRSLVPTTAGLNLYKMVKTFMGELEEGIRYLGQREDTPSGQLRIGAPSEFGKTYLPKIIASFHHIYPKVTFVLELGGPKELFESVSNGKLDFAYIDMLPILLHIPKGLTAYTIDPLVREEFVLACSSKYYTDNIAQAEYDKLISLNYISYKNDIALFQSWFELNYGKAPAALNLVLIADSAQSIVTAIAEDIGAGIIVSHLISNQVEDGSFVQIGTTHEKMKNTIACVHFKDKEETVTEKIFQEYFRKELLRVTNLKILP
ncbi:MAG: LysR family transcriptional regulator [Deltaproteobacteria bacterium]|nr:MAG: LysR family transcriptional regulator [Deltaproteobacteria bacterium]